MSYCGLSEIAIIWGRFSQGDVVGLVDGADRVCWGSIKIDWIWVMSGMPGWEISCPGRLRGLEGIRVIIERRGL